MSRHWYDLARLHQAGIATRALADFDLDLSMARHKSMFFSAKDAAGARIDYEAAVSGGLQLIPTGSTLAALADDLARMMECCLAKPSRLKR